ncbi:NAD(P)H-dependent oxidoreductase [Bisgaard Taxon 10/6]|uniref:NADPH-dependent FMN reductase n=1 Tax=Exercitatus varius TaxID=67857 RepID=UPI00294B0173|nr:NAD(P)H-dependent oxidoreductase [Exercitatus varius]MDG2916350.1 NAD(P)H-dependent oxidoreductase [Exercitatus varius]MDG2958397.1 NAD(P)H-dependent oxidoreductase [Exercitatus varius]
MTKQIAVFVGSASSTSISQIVARYLQSVAPQSIRLNFVEIGDLPLYDRDSDGQNIAQYARVREAVEKADGVLLISPEHNGGVSAMLKNAIDVASRPMGQSKWLGKPAGLVSVAAGAAGGVRVTDQLRTICSGAFINMPVAPFAANVGGVFNGVLNERGEIVSEAVQSMLQNFINAYADFVARF